MDPRLSAVLAGVAFGIWPLLMNRSGLGGNTSAAVFSGLAFLVVLPFAIREGGLAFNPTMVTFAIGAGIAGGLGLLAFNGMLATATPAQVGRLFVIMILVQVAVPAIYQVIMDGGVSLKEGVGLGFALMAALLLA